MSFLKSRIPLAIIALSLLTSCSNLNIALAQSNYPMQANPPSPVQTGSASVIGSNGTQHYYYYIIARYPIGNALRSPAFEVFNAPATLSSGNYVRISWNGLTGATGYDVLRSLVPLPNSGTCTNCLIVSNGTATAYDDQSNATLGNYTVTNAPSAQTNTYLDNVTQPLPAIIHNASQPSTETWTSVVGVDQSGARITKPVRAGTPLPTTCSVPELFYLTTATAGINLYGCTSTNTWTLEGGSGGGIGDVVGPGSATDNACVRFDGTTGKLIQNSLCVIDDSGNMTMTSIATGTAPPPCTPGTGSCIAIGEGTAPTGAGAAVDICYGDSTSHTIKCSLNNGSYYNLPQVIASGTSALGTSAIGSQACATVVTTAATGALSTDAIIVTPNASIKAVTGYVPLTTGGLSITGYVTADAINWDVCNWSTGSITPGAVTLNWRVIR